MGSLREMMEWAEVTCSDYDPTGKMKLFIGRKTILKFSKLYQLLFTILVPTQNIQITYRVSKAPTSLRKTREMVT